MMSLPLPKSWRINLKIQVWLLLILLAFMTAKAFAEEQTKPPHPVNSITIASHVLEKLFHNSHYKVIGSCTWMTKKFPPKFVVTASIEQFLPDLVITVSNKPEENPWIEARAIYENGEARAVYQTLYETATGLPLGFGNDSGQITNQHINDERTRIVDVIGSPMGFYQFPYLSHQAETNFGVPYYLAEADAVMDRTEIAEIVYMATHPTLLVGHEIGSFLHHWGQEIPRLMRVTNPYNFRASVVAAMHAADIVTNQNSLHITHATSNSCGKNCVVSNTIYDPQQTHVIWQEVYPINRNLYPGDADDFGIEDDIKGNGNYVFVLWRKYRGCIQANGKLISSLTFPKVENPEKR